ncbi:deoxynucleoside kinase, partial [Pseudomonas aeruginosa]|nr:deoxynucleoside kinase [Pseudomonas aeruginosa]
MNKPFIAIEGPIGVGKSSLAHKLSQTLDFYEEKEIITENPFLSDFYEDISKASFQTDTLHDALPFCWVEQVPGLLDRSLSIWF